jgi:hypothetical protein
MFILTNLDQHKTLRLFITILTFEKNFFASYVANFELNFVTSENFLFCHYMTFSFGILLIFFKSMIKEAHTYC